MVKNIPEQAAKALKTALVRARKYPSQIADVEAIVDSVAKEMQTPDFSVKAELYKLLTEVSEEGRSTVIHLYRHGLQDAAQEGRINLQKEWEYFFNGEHIWNVLFDKNHQQLIVSTAPEENAKQAAVYAIGIQNGRKNWSFPMKKAQSAFSIQLSESAVYFTIDSHSDNDGFSRIQKPLYALNLENGKLLWKWLPEDEGVQHVNGVFGNLLLARGESGFDFFAINTETKKEEWRSRDSAVQSIFGDLCLVSKGRELVWLDKNGLVQKKLKLASPKKGKGSIRALFENADVVYFSMESSWSTFNKNNELISHSLDIFYAVGKNSGKVLWSFKPTTKDVGCKKIILVGNELYFCGEKNTIVLAKSNGKPVRYLPYSVLCVSGKLVFHPAVKNMWANDGFTFYARDAETDAVKWQRKDFVLLKNKNGLLFGRVENNLVVLDEVTGKERAAVYCGGQPHKLEFIDDITFWVVAYNDFRSKSVVVFRIEDVLS